MDNVIYTNEMPGAKAHITIHPAISSCSPDCIADANQRGIIPDPDLHYFEISWHTAKGTYVHRFNFSTYHEAVRAQELLEKKLFLDADDFIDPMYESRMQGTEKLLKPVRYNRAKAKEWAALLMVPVESLE